mmetsp:Transcript_8482/g.21053  ORF Transcript_8482/g.21053 Transcript_8482/m.21053 type:complete len:213 (+) Transcript_8482:103-741(+)
MRAWPSSDSLPPPALPSRTTTSTHGASQNQLANSTAPTAATASKAYATASTHSTAQHARYHQSRKTSRLATSARSSYPTPPSPPRRSRIQTVSAPLGSPVRRGARVSRVRSIRGSSRKGLMCAFRAHRTRTLNASTGSRPATTASARPDTPARTEVRATGYQKTRTRFRRELIPRLRCSARPTPGRSTDAAPRMSSTACASLATRGQTAGRA